MPGRLAWQVPEQCSPVKKSQTAVSLYAAKAGHVTSDRTEYVSELEKLVE